MKLSVTSGTTFNYLTVVREVEQNDDGRRRFECLCKCGTTKIVHLSHLRSGGVKSCGCWLRVRAQQTAKQYFRKPDGVALRNELIYKYKLDAAKRKLPFTLTAVQVIQMFQSPCAFCGEPPSRCRTRPGRYGSYTFTGIDRLNSALGYISGNCVPCCKDCNFAKQKMSVDAFLVWARRLVSHSQLKTGADFTALAQHFVTEARS